MLPLLRIATWNLGEPRLCAMPLLADAFRAANADLVFLNEVMRGDFWADVRYGRNQITDLAQRCGYAHFAQLDTAGLDPADGSGVKMVGILSRFRLTRRNPLPSIKDNPGGNYRTLEIQTTIGGRTWFLYSLRFSAYVYPNFAAHCRLIRDRILSLPAGTPVIAAGDFNGGAHHISVWRSSPRNDPTIVQNFPPPLLDLVQRTGLRNATDSLPLDDSMAGHPDPEVRVPPFKPATDLILFRGPCELAGFEFRNPHNSCTDSFGTFAGSDHPLLLADLIPHGANAALTAAQMLLAR